MIVRPLRHHRRQWLHRLSGICGLLSVMAVAPVQLAAAASVWSASSLRPTDTWNTLALDMRVNRSRVTSTGEAASAPPQSATYRIERSSASGRWKTVIHIVLVDRSPAYSLTGALSAPRAFPIGRIEDDEDGTPVRVFDTRGVQLAVAASPPAPQVTTTMARATGQQWLEAFIALPERKATRQAAFERQFGKGKKAGTLQRYIKLQTDTSQEVLVDPRTFVPVESNLLKSGKRVGHRMFTYAAAPDSALVRATVQSDTVVTPEGERALVTTSFENIRLELRR